MKDYRNYMNRQAMSGTAMEQLLKLDTERPETAKITRKAPQWMRYSAMAAALVCVFGLFAAAIVYGPGAQPVATQPVAPTYPVDDVAELFFNEVDELPFSRKVTADGSQMKLEPTEIADIAPFFGSSADDFDGFKEDMGWRKFDMEYYWVDMRPDSDALQLLLTGNYVLPGGEEDPLSSFRAVDTFWLQIYEGYSYIGMGGWEGFTACEINGHKVIAAYDRNHGRAGAIFDVECNGKTYGVRYTVTTMGGEYARELVTKLVRHITKDGLYPEMYGVRDDCTLSYAELTDPSAGGLTVWTGVTDRPLTREELEAVYPTAAGADGENYIWYGTAYYKADGNLRLVSIQGDRMDETASVNIVFGVTEADVCLRNRIEKDGKRTYFGAENTVFTSGLDLLRCFYVQEPGYFNDTANAYHCYAQYKPNGSSKYVQVRTCVESGSLLENETFNEEWFDRTAKGGLWSHTGTINGKEVWDLPKVEKPVELSGSYFMELGDEETVVCPVMIFYDDGDFVCGSDWASSHLCRGRFTVKGGQVTANCDQHRFVFDILDEDTLRYVGEESDDMVRYVEPKVTDGAVFRREEVVYGEEIADHINALEADLNNDMHHAEPSHNVESTHHPEPSDHVETNHHEEERHSFNH